MVSFFHISFPMSILLIDISCRYDPTLANDSWQDVRSMAGNQYEWAIKRANISIYCWKAFDWVNFELK